MLTKKTKIMHTKLNKKRDSPLLEKELFKAAAWPVLVSVEACSAKRQPFTPKIDDSCRPYCMHHISPGHEHLRCIYSVKESIPNLPRNCHLSSQRVQRGVTGPYKVRSASTRDQGSRSEGNNIILVIFVMRRRITVNAIS